jgi:hypothetical protein
MSEIKVNKISPRTNCGTTTLGDSGDTFTIPAGVSITNNGTASGFGATGAVSWNTTVKTSGFTAVAGEGYFVDTTSGAITVNLPAGTAGAVVGFKDYAKTFDTNNVTLNLNGSDKAGGSTTDPKLQIEGQAVTLVFIDSTQGWLVTDSGLQSDANQAEFVTATGGTITTCGNFKIHSFTGPGTFCVSNAGNSQGSNTVDYLVVAGGGGGGMKISGPYNENGGGAGAGGYRESSGAASGCYSRSPLGACVSALPVSVQGYPIAVGGGGTGGQTSPSYVIATAGAVSTFSTISSAGGGLGGSSGPSGGGPDTPGGAGGSGGGGAARAGSAGAGNTPPVSPPQGNNGNNSENPSPPFSDSGAGGGGGAGAVGGRGGIPCNPGTTGGAGGAGVASSITGSPVTRAGGGGGAGGSAGAGGSGGGGPGLDGVAGTANTGGGGGGAGSTGSNPNGGTGGSGIVIIRYKFQ